MALTISPDQFADIKNNKKFEDLLFVDLVVDSWSLPSMFHMVNCAFRGCKFGGEVNFVGGIMKNITFQDCEFEGVSFVSTPLTRVTFSNCKLRNKCLFKNAPFNESKFNNCFIVGATFANEFWVGSTINGGVFVHNNIDGLKYRVTGELFNNIEEYEGNTGNPKKI